MQQSLVVRSDARGDEKWSVLKWHLRQSVDPMGNRIDYTYLPQTQDVVSCGNDHAVWYHNAALPQEIRWSGNASGGNLVAPYLRVHFEYASRSDYKIDGWVGNDCMQAMYTQNRLRRIYVEAYDKDIDDWTTLHHYILNHSYTNAYNASVPYEHLLLDNVVRRGADDNFLSQQEFTYQQLGTGGTPEQEDRVHTRWYLTLAKNGWGGSVKYKYEQTSNMEECNYSENNNLEGCDTTDYRRRVDRKSLKDVLGNWSYTDYDYGSAAQRHYEYEDTYDFLGHDWVEVNTQPLNQPDKDVYPAIKVERSEFYRGTANAPDSRYGRVKRLAVYDLDTAVCEPDQQENVAGEDRCLLSETRNLWKTYEHEDTIPNPDPTKPTWQLAGNDGEGAFGTRSSWPRLEESTRIVDGKFVNGEYIGGAKNIIKYEYAEGPQGGAQYGNVTRSELHDEEGLLKSTETEYVPNPPDDGDNLYIVGLPARVRLLGSVDNCVAETRTVYGRGNVGGSYTDLPIDALVARSEQALTACSTGSPPPATIGDYDANWAVTTFGHDDLGNVTSVERFGDSTDGSQNVRIDTQYDGYYRLFPVQQSNFYDGSFVETAAYYGVNGYTLADGGAYWGRLAEHCNVNDVCTRQRYDEWGRRTRRWDSVPAGETWGGDATADVYWKYYRSGESGVPASGVAEWHSPRCKGNIARSFHDGWGRVVAQHSAYLDWEENFDCSGQSNAGREVHSYFAYDALGRQQRASVPEIVPRSQFGTIPSQVGSNDWTGSGARDQTQTAYDVLGRPVRVTAPNGEVTEHNYVARAHSVVRLGQNGDPDRLLKWTATDGQGELEAVRTYAPNANGDFVNPPAAEVRFDHGVQGDLLEVEHPTSVGSVTSTMTYDAASRKLSMDDPDLGYWSYAYDRHGNLTRQTDAKGQTICLDYDGHTNRLLGKHFRGDTNCPAPGAGSYNVTYSYDESQLTQVAYANGDYQRDLGYDGRGFLTNETVTIAGTSALTSQYVFDEYDRAYATVYPDGSVVKVAFNGMGLPNTLCDGEYNASAGAYFCTSDPFLVDGDTDDNLNSATGVDYNELGQATEMRFPAGGGLWRHNLYYAWDDAAWGGFSNSDRNRRLAEIRVGTSTNVASGADSHNRLRLRHFYDSHGNLDVLHEQYSGGSTDTHSFAYDDQNRLTDGFGSNTFAYDSSGRLEFFEDEDYTPLSNAFPVHAVKGPDYAYDANGNMTTRPNYTLSWDHENRLASVTGGGIYPSEDYLYDADGMRVKKTSDGKASYYPFPHYEVHDGTIVKYYFFGGMRIAQRRDGVLTYLHGNHLGSTVLETSTSGVEVNNERYFAYGEQRGLSQVNTENQYTDQKRDDTGLYYYGARYYDPSLGTFVSPDSIVPNTSHVFGYNRFMYTYGNPLRFVDPTGHQACSTNRCWQDRWYNARGFFWNAGTGHWSNTGQAVFADAEILSETVGEAGIKFDSGNFGRWQWQFDEMALVGQGVVALAHNVGGLSQLQSLLGGGTTIFERINWDGGSRLAAMVGYGFKQLPFGIYQNWISVFDNAFSSDDYFRGLVVHELAHVIDFNHRVHGRAPSKSFPQTSYLSLYAQDNPKEYWGEAVTDWVYGSTYKGPYRTSNPPAPNDRTALTQDQVDWLERSLRGWGWP